MLAILLSIWIPEISVGLTFKPDALRGTLAKISSANARVSPDEDSPNSTSLLTTSAGDVACLAATKVPSPLDKKLTMIINVFHRCVIQRISHRHLHSPIIYWTTVGWEYPTNVINLSDTQVFKLLSLPMFCALNNVTKSNQKVLSKLVKPNNLRKGTLRWWD